MTTILKNGKPLAVIVLPENAKPEEQYAASELRHYLGMMSMAEFEIAQPAQNQTCIALGRAGELIGATAEQPLGEDGFALVSQPGGIAVLGGRRGVIYGVYELLERLGCRFFTATCEKIPASETLQVPKLSVTQVPVLEYREHNYYELSRYPRFALKCRLNGSFHPIPDKMGGHLSYAWYVHTFDAMVPPAKYGAEHPEYYALSGGVRKTLPHQNQLCLSNPDVLEICIESVRRRLRETPAARIISISQNDWGGNCECEQCRKSDGEEGSPAGTLLRFVNAVAERLEPEFPDVLFDTLAYQYTRPAPKSIRPRHNVCVRLCSIESCFAHSFESCDDESRSVTRPDGSRSSFINDLREWGRVSNRTYIWDYTTCFAHYPTPHPNWNVLQPNMRAFVKNGVRGVFEQANGASHGGTDLNELRAYIISKLLWDAETDVARHIEEFTDYYYGAAGPYIRQYIKTITEKAERDDIHVGFNDNPDHGFLTNEMLDVYTELFSKAKKAVRGDPPRLWRVGKAELSIRYVRMKNNAMLRGVKDRGEINAFFSDWKAYGLTRIEEWVSPETSLRAMLADKWRGVEFYGHWADEGGEQL